MFGIGATEMVIIGVVLLLAVGPQKLPKLLKAVVKGYREFRRATRDLRASTGIDELLRDEDLRDLRKPLHFPTLSKKAGKGEAGAKKRALTYTERVQENPPEGVDLAEIREAESQPSEEERDALIAAKNASLADDDTIRHAKIAAADERDPDEEEEARQAKIDAAQASDEDPEEAEQRRQAKIDAKIAAAEEEAEEAGEV